MLNQQKLVISNEDEAFALLERALKEEFANQPVSLELKNWPRLELRYEGKGYDSVITPDIATALLAIQKAIDRAYARTIYRSANPKNLTAEERQAIQMKAKVESGSSLITIDLGEFAEKIGLKMIDKMTSTELIILVLGLAAIAGGHLSYKAYLNAKSKDKILDNETRRSIELSREETNRLQIFASVIKALPFMKYFEKDFEKAKSEIVRSIGDAEHIAIHDINLTKSSSEEILACDRDDVTTRHKISEAFRSMPQIHRENTFNQIDSTNNAIDLKKQEEPLPKQFQGRYLISAIDHRQEGKVGLQLKNLESSHEFFVSFIDGSFTDMDRDILQRAIWNKTPVDLSINGTELRGEITNATLISASIPKTDSESL